jgi:hypothetical protein
MTRMSIFIGHEYVAGKAGYARIDDEVPACAGDFRTPATKRP